MELKFDTDIEREFFRAAYKATWELAQHMLTESNKILEEEGREDEWPAMQEWDDLSGSSQSIFMAAAREELGLLGDLQINRLRNNSEAMAIAIEIREGSTTKHEK